MGSTGTDLEYPTRYLQSYFKSFTSKTYLSFLWKSLVPEIQTLFLTKLLPTDIFQLLLYYTYISLYFGPSIFESWNENIFSFAEYFFHYTRSLSTNKKRGIQNF